MSYDLTFIKELERYKDFEFCPADYPDGIEFQDLFPDEDYDIVQVHLMDSFIVDGYKDIVGFVGSFKWVNNTLTPLDGDSYSPCMNVYGFERFDYFEPNDDGAPSTPIRGLDILVDSF